MRIRSLAIVVLTGIVSVVSMPAMSAASWQGYGHKLRIKMDGYVTRSIWVAGTAAPGWPNSALNTCLTLKKVPPRGWLETSFVLQNNTQVKAIAFESWNCTNGYRREKSMTVPQADGLDYVYLSLF